MSYNPYGNPYLPNYTAPVIQSTALPKMEIPKVHGEESAKAFPLGPDSSVILLDTSDPLIWVVTTDASGFKSINPFKITPYQKEEPVKPEEINNKLDAITIRIDKLEEMINHESNSEPAWKNKSGNANSQSNARNVQSGSKS